MGLVGFLGVLGYYHKASLPPGFLRSILLSIALIAAIGLLAHRLIDNAAHLGGAIAGIALATALVRRADSLPLSPSRHVIWFGQLAAAMILIVTVTSIYKIAHPP
jgi:hypothetical protein